MKGKNKNIHLRFLVAGILFVIYGYWFSEGFLDINLHQTYFVIEHGMLYFLFGGYLFFCGTLYFTLGPLAKRAIKGTQAHYLLTVLPVIALIVFIKYPMGDFDQWKYWISLFLFLALGSQILLPINIIRSLFAFNKTEELI